MKKEQNTPDISTFEAKEIIALLQSQNEIIKDLQNKLEQSEMRYEQLMEQIQLERTKQFEASSEQSGDLQVSLFDEVELYAQKTEHRELFKSTLCEAKCTSDSYYTNSKLNEKNTNYAVENEKTIADNDWFKYVQVSFVLNDRHFSNYNMIKMKNESVVAVVRKNEEFLVLVQYRPIVGLNQIELPCGSIETSEDIVTAARREVFEETGVVVNNPTYIGHYYPSNGISDQKIHIVHFNYESGDPNPLDGEASKVGWISIDRLKRKLSNFEVLDSPTIIALQNYLLFFIDSANQK